MTINILNLVIKFNNIQQISESMKKETQNETALKNVEKSNLPMFHCWIANRVNLRICSKTKE